jgi:hypothetical protein
MTHVMARWLVYMPNHVHFVNSCDSEAMICSLSSQSLPLILLSVVTCRLRFDHDKTRVRIRHPPHVTM